MQLLLPPPQPPSSAPKHGGPHQQASNKPNQEQTLQETPGKNANYVAQVQVRDWAKGFCLPCAGAKICNCLIPGYQRHGKPKWFQQENF